MLLQYKNIASWQKMTRNWSICKAFSLWIYQSLSPNFLVRIYLLHERVQNKFCAPFKWSKNHDWSFIQKDHKLWFENNQLFVFHISLYFLHFNLTAAWNWHIVWSLRSHYKPWEVWDKKGLLRVLREVWSKKKRNLRPFNICSHS